ncbi:MAG: hypothetical protein LBM77_11735 [Spirochaetaceae bacterium]|jgi:hypothetical protein|nr:hypothetical protein [Spirochaetaceae bacterium]
MPVAKKHITNEMIWGLLLKMQAELVAQRNRNEVPRCYDIPNAETQEAIRKTDEAIAEGRVKHITSLEQYKACVDTDDDDTVYSFDPPSLFLETLHYDAEHMEV